MTRSSYRLLGALESPSNDPLFRALCYQPFREEHRGRWPPVLLFHGANERSAVSRFDRDKRDRAPTRRCRTLSPSGRRRYVVRRVRVYGVCATWSERAAYPRSMRRPALIGSPIDFGGRTNRSSSSRLPIGGRGIAVGRALSRSNTTVVRVSAAKVDRSDRITRITLCIAWSLQLPMSGTRMQGPCHHHHTATRWY